MFDSDFVDILQLSTTHGRGFESKILSPRDIEHIVALYDGEIRSVDDSIGDLLDYLVTTGLLKETLFLVTSDHGESFHRGFIGHGGSARRRSEELYDELIRVPLILQHPTAGPKRIVRSIQLIDVMPTLLAMLQLPIPSNISGIDIFSSAAKAERPSISEMSSYVSIRSGGFKLIASTHQLDDLALYDLVQDPGERVNCAVTHPEMLQVLHARLEAWRTASRKSAEVFQATGQGRSVTTNSAPKSLTEELRTLGYVE